MTAAIDRKSKKPSYDYVFKIIVIGDSFAGKSSLVTQFVEGRFDDNFSSTIGIDIKIKTITLPLSPLLISSNIKDNDEKKKKTASIKLIMYDTAGQCRFRTLSKSYYRGAHGCLLVFDVNERESFERIESWLTELKGHCIKKLTPVIIGNKIDLRHDSDNQYTSNDDKKKVPVSTEELKELATKHGCKWFETSAKKNININDVFDQLTTDMMEVRIKDDIADLDTITSAASLVNLSTSIDEEKIKKQKLKNCC
jgi:small GTP-binding protein